MRSVRHLSALASRMNKNLPMLTDSRTELMNVTALEGTLVYNSRLLNMGDADLSPGHIRDALRPNIVNAACTTPELRATFLDRGVAMRYTYSDENRKFIVGFDVSKADCVH